MRTKIVKISKLKNLAFITGILPDKTKIPKVKPIYKPGRKYEIKNSVIA